MRVHSVHLLPARQLSWNSPMASAPGLSRHSPDEQIVSHRDRFAQSWSRRKTSLNVNMLSISPPAGYRPSLPACGCRSGTTPPYHENESSLRKGQEQTSLASLLFRRGGARADVKSSHHGPPPRICDLRSRADVTHIFRLM